MNSGKIGAGRVDGTGIEGSIRGPRGPKKNLLLSLVNKRQVQRGAPSSSGGCASMTFGRKHVFQFI